MQQRKILTMYMLFNKLLLMKQLGKHYMYFQMYKSLYRLSYMLQLQMPHMQRKDQWSIYKKMDYIFKPLKPWIQLITQQDREYRRPLMTYNIQSYKLQPRWLNYKQEFRLRNQHKLFPIQRILNLSMNYIMQLCYQDNVNRKVLNQRRIQLRLHKQKRILRFQTYKERIIQLCSIRIHCCKLKQEFLMNMLLRY